MTIPPFECKRCGDCCKKVNTFAFVLYEEELKVWEGSWVESNYGYYPALAFVARMGDTADLFFHPVTGDELFRCPFLRKDRNKDTYKCLLHGTKLKPKVCVNYGVTVKANCHDDTPV